MATQATQTSGKVIGFVRQVVGEVKATGSDGVSIILQVGDLVYADEQIVSGELGSIEIVFNDGGNLILGRNSQGLLDADVYQTTTPEDGSEYAASIDAIQQAILLGEDPTAIQEAPAAGAGESAAGNEGISFVTVERTGEQTTPESGFETEGLVISLAESEGSESLINLLPTIDLDGDDNSQIGVGYISHFTENGGTTPIADADIQVSNPDGTTLESASIVLANAQDGDELDVSGITGLSVEVDSSVPGVITVLLSGTATPQVYAEAIRNIGFNNSTENPDETPRIVEVTVNDGEFDSNTAVTTITVQAVNDPSVVDLDSNDSTNSGYGYLASFTEGDAAISIADTDVSVTDVDNETLQSATVTLTNPQADDVMAFGDMPAGLSAVIDGYTITISGEGTLAEYQGAIQAVTFENTSENPSAETRVIEITVNDGELNSETAVTHIEVHGVNDVAVIDLDGDDSSSDGNGYETTFVENGAVVSVVDDDVVITDVDDANIESATIELTNNQSDDQLVIGIMPAGITATVDVTTVTLVGTASLATYEQALQAVFFVNTSEDPATEDRVINITLNDGDGNSDSAVSIIHVMAVNDPPDANEDLIATQEDTPVRFSVTWNDIDAEGDQILVTSHTQPSNGTLSRSSNGTFQYTPNTGFTGTDSFTYTITDGNGGYDTATVSITVAGVNDGPDAVSDSATTNENTPVTINVLSNDSDPEGDVLSISSFSQGANGTVTIDSVTGNPVYTPTSGFTGIDTFTYSVSDGNGGTDTATVTVNVNGIVSGDINGVPVAGDDTVSTNVDVPVTVNVRSNDRDPDGDALTVRSVTQGESGSVTIDSVSGNPVYTPNPGFNGSDTFTYIIDDGNGGTDSATVTVRVFEGNDLPATSDNSVSTDEDTPYIFDISDFAFSDTDSGDTLQMVRIDSLPNDGALFLNGVELTNAGVEVLPTVIESGGLTFVPDQHESGDNSYNTPGSGDQTNDYAAFEFSVNDGTDWSADSSTMTIDVVPVADAPMLLIDDVHASDGTELIDLVFVPNSVGLTQTVYSDLGNSIRDGDTLESRTDGLTGGATTVVTQPYRAGGNGPDNIPQHSVEVTTGLVFLEAGTTISFSGYLDDAFLIELGGNTLVSTTGDAWGSYDTSVAETTNIGAGTVTTTGDLQIQQSGYYTFELYIYNHNGPGDLSINATVNGVTTPFNTDNFNIYPDISSIDASNGQYSEFILGSENGTDGGAYPVEINRGFEGSDIKISSISPSLIDADGSESLGCSISGIPEGAVLTDGSHSFTATSGSTQANVDGWDLDSLHFLPPDGLSGSLTLSFMATATETSTDDQVTRVEDVQITVLPDNGDPVVDLNDQLAYRSSQVLDGGDGLDALLVSGNQDLDFSGIDNIRNMERIDLTDGDHDITNLSVADVLNMTDNDNLLEILGDVSDSVELTSDWHATSNTFIHNGHTFTEYLSGDDSVTLLIEDQVNVTIV
jgi:hypothetical protein